MNCIRANMHVSVFHTFSSPKHKAKSFAVSLLQRCTFFFYNIITVNIYKSIVRCAALPERTVFIDSPSHTHNPLHWHHILFIQDEGERKAMIGKAQYNCTQMISAVCIICTVMHGTQMTFICIYIYMVEYTCKR